MPAAPDEKALARLIEVAHHQTLARFEKETSEGTRDAPAELAEYRRQRRDYASLLRIGRIPEEARELSLRLLETQGIALPAAMREKFERDVTALLIRLYDEFIARTTSQDNR